MLQIKATNVRSYLAYKQLKEITGMSVMSDKAIVLIDMSYN